MTGYKKWEDILDSSKVDMLRANAMDLSLLRHDSAAIDIVAVEGTGNIEEDADLCRRLKERFDVPLLLTGSYLSENSSLIAYKAGVDECIAGHVSDALIRAKVMAWLRWSERVYRVTGIRPGNLAGLSKKASAESTHSSPVQRSD